MAAAQKQPSPFKQQLTRLDGTLKQMIPSFKAALPAHLVADKLVRIVLTEVQHRPELLECTPGSFLRALLRAAQLGLYPDSVLGLAYLVPFNDRKAGVTNVQLIIGYKGIIQLALRSDHIAAVYAEVVYENDTLEVELGDRPRLRHVPTLKGDRGKRVLAYAVATFKDKDVPPMFKVLTEEDVEKRRASSKARDRGPWVDHTDAMWRKSAVRALAPFLPLSPEDARLITRDELEEDETVELELTDDVIELLGDGSDQDVDSAAAGAATAAKQQQLRGKYAKREPGDEPLHPCCGELASGPHKADCPNVER